MNANSVSKKIKLMCVNQNALLDRFGVTHHAFALLVSPDMEEYANNALLVQSLTLFKLHAFVLMPMLFCHLIHSNAFNAMLILHLMLTELSVFAIKDLFNLISLVSETVETHKS